MWVPSRVITILISILVQPHSLFHLRGREIEPLWPSCIYRARARARPCGLSSCRHHFHPGPLTPCFCCVFSLGQRYTAGCFPGQSCALAGRLLCLQPLPVLWLLPGGPAVHPPLPAKAATHPPTLTPPQLSCSALDGGRPALPEGCWHPVSAGTQPWQDFYRKSHFCLRVSPLCSQMVLFFLSLFVLLHKIHCVSALLSRSIAFSRFEYSFNWGAEKMETHLIFAA